MKSGDTGGQHQRYQYLDTGALLPLTDVPVQRPTRIQGELALSSLLT
jgi:hypothetical protein